MDQKRSTQDRFAEAFFGKHDFASAYNPEQVANYIVEAAQARNIDPRIALQVAKSEGLYSYTGDSGSSFGPFQLHYGNVASGGNKVGGLGDVFTQQTGYDARDPRTWKHQIDFSLDTAAKEGWGAWHGWKGDKWAGLAGYRPANAPLYDASQMAPPSSAQLYDPNVMRTAAAPPPLPAPSMMSPTPIAEVRTFEAPKPQEMPATQMAAPAVQPQAPVAQPTPAPIVATDEQKFPSVYDRLMGNVPARTQAPAAPPPPPPPEQPVAAVPQATSWGAPQSFARGLTSGATLGFGDMGKAGATLGALADLATGNLGQEGFMARRKQYFEGLESQRRQYEAEHPIISSIAQEAGNIGGLMNPLGAYSRAAQLVGRGARAVAPRAASFLAGEGAGTFATPLSHAARGAIEGVGQTAASQGLMPQEERWNPQSMALAGAAGGVIGGAVSPFFSSLSRPFQAAIADADRQAAINVTQKHGIHVRPSQIAQDAHINSLDKELVPGEVNDKQVKDVTAAVAKMAGVRSKELTPQNVHLAMRANGNLLDKIAEKTNFTPVTPNLGAELAAIEQKLFRKWGPPEMAGFDKFKRGLMQELTRPSNNLGGERYRYIVKRNGLIDKSLYDVNPSAAFEVRHAFENMFKMTDPAKAALYKRASDRYKLLDGLQSIVKDHGVLDPTLLASVAKNKKIGGDFAELASVGKKMSGIDANGNAKVRASARYGTRLGEAFGSLGPTIAAYAGYTTPAAAVLGTGAAGAHAAADYFRKKVLTSPSIAEQVLKRKPGKFPRMMRQGENVLTGGVGQLIGGVGSEGVFE